MTLQFIAKRQDPLENPSKEESRATHYIFACLYAALAVAIGVFFAYGGPESGLGSIAGIIGGVVTFFCALVLSPFFALARTSFSNTAYFFSHLFVGLLIGVWRTSSNPYVIFVTNTRDYFLSHDTILVACASLAAWLYVVLHVPGPTRPSEHLLDRLRADASRIQAFALPVFIIPIVFAPYLPTDPSCHNELRGGLASNSPKLTIELMLDSSEEPKLRTLYEKFASENHLESRVYDNSQEAIPVSLCTTDMNISTGKIYGNRASVSFFTMGPNSNWRKYAKDLICRLEAEWPGQIYYLGPGSKRIEKPTEITIDCLAE